MKTLKIIICTFLVLCGSLVLSACGSKESKKFDVNKIMINEFTEYTYDGQPHVVTVSYSGNKNTKVTYALESDGKNFKSANKLGLVDAGTYNIYFRLSAKGYKTYTSTGTLELTINQRELNVHIADQIKMKSELNGPLSFSYSTEGVIEGDEISLSPYVEGFDPATVKCGDEFDILWNFNNPNYVLNADEAKLKILEYVKLTDSEGTMKGYYADIQDAIDNASNGDVVVINKSKVVNSSINIDKEITIDGQNTYSLTASAYISTSEYQDKEISSIFNLTSSSAKLNLKDITINGGEIARSVTAFDGSVELNNATIKNGRQNDDFKSAGLYITDNASLKINSATFERNIANDETFGNHAADIWFDSNKELIVDGGTIGDVYVGSKLQTRDASNVSKMTLNDGKIDSVYVDYNVGKYGLFNYVDGELSHLYVALKNENGEVQGIAHEIEVGKGKTYEGGKLVYANTITTFMGVEFDEQNPIPNFTDGWTYIFEDCNFIVPFATAKKVRLVFNNCVFETSVTATNLYVAKVESLTVGNCTFSGNTTGGYAIDVNLFSTTCDNVMIANNVFNTTSVDNNGAISVKTRLGGNDFSTEEWAQGQAPGFIHGEVLICGNNFNEDNNIVEIGTFPQANNTTANTSTGDFKVVVESNAYALTIYNKFKVDDQTQDTDEGIKVSIIAGGEYDSTQN